MLRVHSPLVRTPGLRRRGVGIDACCFVEGGRASLNHAHYRGRTTPLRLSLTDVARVLRPHGFSICGFPREGREKIPNHAQWVLNHLRHGGARYPYNTRRFLS